MNLRRVLYLAGILLALAWLALTVALLIDLGVCRTGSAADAPGNVDCGNERRGAFVGFFAFSLVTLAPAVLCFAFAPAKRPQPAGPDISAG